MNRAKTTSITLACAYCAGAVIVPVGRMELRRAGDNRFARAGKICTATCPHCDSAFEISIATKRKRKGKRLREIEQKRADAFAAKLIARRELNAAIGGQLLVQPGCTCGDEIARRARRSGDAFAFADDHGHRLSTSATRHGDDPGLLPNYPRHLHACPLHGSDAERECIDRTVAAFRTLIAGDIADDVGRENGATP